MIEEKQQELQRKKEIGQFFTPQSVVEFIYDMLKVHLDKEEKWKKGKFPSIVDPACGEGIFLKVALDKKITKPKYVFGVDIDNKVKEKWMEITLLKSFGSKAKLDIHFYHQNGLQSLPKNTLRYKRSGLNQYDLVVGNPPYGGVGLQKITPQLHDALLKFEIWRKALKQNGISDTQLLFDIMPENLSKAQEERLKRFPLEILFVERFIQITKSGGHIAIVVPDGILSNSNLHYVREFIAEKVKVDAIVSLPRETFKNVGTSAKTSILFMTKPLDDKIDTLDYPVFLASVERLEYLNKVYEFYCRYQKEGNLMNPVPKKVVVAKDSEGNEAVTVRVDITLGKMFEQKPMTRWDGPYWDPKYDDLLPLLKKWNAMMLEEVEGKDCIISGDHVRPSRGEKKGYNLNTEIEYYETKNFLLTGYDYSKIKECSKNAYERLKYTEVRQYDILISCAGVGGVGKARSCLIAHKPRKKSCTGDVFIIRLKELSPFLVYIILNSFIGRAQILRTQSGVGTVNINSEQALSLKIPNFPENIQSHIESEYKKMSIYHDKAMQAKTEDDENNYKKNIDTAEKMLKELIVRTEAVIRGERKDVV